MATLDEKRVYSEKTSRTRLYVASDLGLALVSVVDDRIGEFSLVHRTPVRSVATTAGRLAVATDEDVLVGSSHDDLAPLEIGPATAVGFAEEALVVASETGEVVRVTTRSDDPSTDDGDRVTIGTLDVPANAVDGELIATDAGVYRVADDLTHVGLADVADVSSAGTPLAATDDALYKLGNGWMDVLAGAFRCVSAEGSAGSIRRAHAATDAALYALAHRDGEDSAWIDVTPENAGVVVDVGYDGGVYAVTDDGTIFARADGDGDDGASIVDGGWRSRALGLHGVRELAVRR